MLATNEARKYLAELRGVPVHLFAVGSILGLCTGTARQLATISRGQRVFVLSEEMFAGHLPARSVQSLSVSRHVTPLVEHLAADGTRAVVVTCLDVMRGIEVLLEGRLRARHDHAAPIADVLLADLRWIVHLLHVMQVQRPGVERLLALDAAVLPAPFVLLLIRRLPPDVQLADVLLDVGQQLGTDVVVNRRRHVPPKPILRREPLPAELADAGKYARMLLLHVIHYGRVTGEELVALQTSELIYISAVDRVADVVVESKIPAR